VHVFGIVPYYSVGLKCNSLHEKNALTGVNSSEYKYVCTNYKYRVAVNHGLKCFFQCRGPQVLLKIFRPEKVLVGVCWAVG
jgi:hypothetical protein